MPLEHYQRIISLLAEATFILGGSGQVFACNPVAAHMLDVPPSAANFALQDFLAKAEADLIAFLRRCSRSKQSMVDNLVLQTKDGVLPFTAKGALLEPRDERAEAVILLRLYPKAEANRQFNALRERIDDLNHEISKRRRAEYDLRAQKRWLQVTLASIGDAVITTDTQGRITFLNPVAEVMTGWSKEEATGEALTVVFKVFNEYTGEAVENPATLALREGRVVALANHSILVARDGTEISIEDTAAPIILDNEINGAILVFHDVTDRRQLERQLLKRAETLELANRRKNEFLTMLAHELRSPLAPINNALEIMSLQRDKPPSFEVPQKVISRQVQHLKRLIDDMLDVSRITRGKMNVVRGVLDLSELVREASSDFNNQFVHAGIGFRVDVPDGKCWVNADRDRITQVLHNLLGNAIKFTPANGRVTVSLRTEEENAVLAVTDSGIGIDKTLMSDIFEPFTQATQNLDRRTGGLGLGLSLVKGIIALHDGQVSAASSGPHQGSTFTVCLPLVNEGSVSQTVNRSPDAAPVQRILLIEDEKDAAETMCLLLELMGHEVEIARSGPEGIKKAVAFVPNLIICDIGLPGLDGFAVARNLRQNPITSSIPIVALTGYGDSEFVSRAKEAGFDHHITKPATFNDIQNIVALKSSRPNLDFPS